MLWVNQVVVLLPMTSGRVPEEAVSVCELGGAALVLLPADFLSTLCLLSSVQ